MIDILQKMLRLTIATGLFGMLGGCSALQAISAVSPADGNSTKGIEYSASKGLKLDIYTPDPATLATNGAPAVIVFFYGGGWESGERSEYRFVASRLTRLGHIVVIPDYRKYPETLFPGFIEDAADAVNWVSKEIHRFGGEPENIFLAGHSAGAQIAALLHYDETWLALDATVQRPCGLIGLSGPYDFLPLVSPTLKAVFPAELRPASQPINFVSGTEGPALLIHGRLDKTVNPRNSTALAETVKAAGGYAKLLMYPEEKHASIVLALASPLAFLAPVVTDIDAFVSANSCVSED